MEAVQQLDSLRRLNNLALLDNQIQPVVLLEVGLRLQLRAARDCLAALNQRLRPLVVVLLPVSKQQVEVPVYLVVVHLLLHLGVQEPLLHSEVRVMRP